MTGGTVHCSFRARVLIASCCASMGADIPDVRVVVNVGKPSSDWILSQQIGRAGRDGQQSVAVNLACAVRVACMHLSPLVLTLL